MKKIFITLSLIITSCGSPENSSLMKIDDSLITCLKKDGNLLPINNEQTLDWKYNTPNQYKSRSHIKGVVTEFYKRSHSHTKFQIKIGKGSNDTIEVVYNNSFGNLPWIKKGMAVEVCGEYITSNKKAGQYDPSPDGALIHWVHRSCSSYHKHGFLKLDGAYFGTDEEECQ